MFTRTVLALLVLAGLAGAAPPEEGSRPQRTGPGSASPMRYFAVTKLDPLTGSTMDSPGCNQTPFMAGSTGAWGQPAAGSPQSAWKTRATGVEPGEPAQPQPKLFDR